MFLAVIFLQQLLIKYVLKKTQQAFPPALPMSDVVALVKLPINYGTTNEPEFLKFTPFVLTICPDFSLIVH